MYKRRLSGMTALLTILTLAAVMLLGACGDNTPTSSTAATTAATTATTAAVTTAAMTSAAAPATTAAMTSATAMTTAAMTSAAAPATTAAVTTAATATTAAAAPAGSGTMTPFAVKAPDNIKAGPGVDTTNKVIKIGAIGALSGPIAVGGKPLVRGQEVYFKALNDAGGIGGYKVEMVEGDSQYAPQLAVQQYTKIAPDVAMFGQVIGAPSAAALKDQAESDKTLILAATSDSSILNYKYVFTTPIPYPLETINGIDYLVKQQNKKSAKFAFVYQDDAYGQDSLKGYKAIVQADGLTDVGQIPYKVTDKDFTAQVTQLKSSGAEVVFMASQPAQTAAIMGASAQLGVSPQWVLQSSAFNTQLLATPIKDILLNKSLFVAYGVPWGSPTAPSELQKLAAIAKYAPDQKADNYFSSGWTYGIVTANILAKAIQNGDLSRDGIFKAFESTKNIDLGYGPGQPSISYGSTPNERVPYRLTTIFKFDATDPIGYVPLSQPFTSDAARDYKF